MCHDGLDDTSKAIMVTAAQLRAARAYLGWTMAQTAEASGISLRTVIRLENGESRVRGVSTSLRKIVAVFREQQIVFEEGGFLIARTVPGKQAGC